MLSNEEQRRYRRQLQLPEIAAAGQQRLRAARVLVIGVGGLGSPVVLYLAAAGIGTLGLVDPDVVELSNLQRQVLYRQDDLGRRKVEAAAAHLQRLNPHLEVIPYPEPLDSALARELVPEYDIVVDACDSIATRLVSNHACLRAGRAMVYGAVDRFHGQVAVLCSSGGPCYRCLFPEPPDDGPSVAPVGPLGPLPGMIGTIQANEVIKLVVGCGEPLVGRLLLVDMLAMQVREVRVSRDADCPVCGGPPERSLGGDESGGSGG